MKMVRKPESVTRGSQMLSEKRCNTCGLWSCEHMKQSDNISLGEPIGERVLPKTNLVDARITTVERNRSSDPPPRFRVVDLATAGPTKSSRKEDDDNTLYKTVSTIPMGPAPEAQRVLIPPPPKVPTIVGPSSPITRVSDTDTWVDCNICQAHINVKYLDEHQKIHIGAVSSSSRAIVRTGASSSTSSSSTSSTVISSEKKDNKPKLNALEHYNFRPIADACAASSMSQDGRYSDVTVIYWMQDKTNATTTHYGGGTTTSTVNAGERLSVHVVYDSLEDYYTVTIKLLKRNSYSTYDSEENVPDRICGNPRELMGEIKRALLFFRISPKVAYKKFRKLFKQNLKIEYDTSSRACICQTQNCEELFDKLKKYSSSSSDYSGHGYHHGHGWCGE